MDTLEFTRENFYQMYQENMTLNARILETFSMYINLFIYESAHQDYNNAFIKICNLLYLFSIHSPTGTPNRIDLTQQDIADILTISLVNVTTNLAKLRGEKVIISHRKWIEIADYPKLVSYCSNETINSWCSLWWNHSKEKNFLLHKNIGNRKFIKFFNQHKLWDFLQLDT